MTDFITYLLSLAPEGETALFVKQKPVGKGLVLHADGTLKCTWPAYYPTPKMKEGEAWYVNTGSFIEERLDKDKPSASAANCEFVLCMMLDDIGTKSKVPPLAPTWIIETSEGSLQYGYAFSEQPTKADFTAAIRAIADAGYTDAGATNAVRNFRVPGSTNLKPGRNGFVSHLIEFHPEREFVLADICTALKVTPGPSDTASINPIKLRDTQDDDVLAWLNEQGLVLSKVNNEGWCSVVCPNAHEHTDGDSAARYQPLTRSFCCYHGHCIDLDSQTFLDWVGQNGGPQKTHGLREELLQETMTKTLSKLTPTDMFTDDATKIIEEIERKELARVEKADWYKRFAYIQDDESYFDMQDRREVSRATFNALYRHVKCNSIHSDRRIEASICYDENRQTMGAKALVGITYAAGESVLVARDGDIFGNRWRDARPKVDKQYQGNVEPWLQHGRRLIPEEDELQHMFDVMAYKLQYPQKKINHAVLHAGKEGCGKDTFWAPFIWAVCGPHMKNRGFMDNNTLNTVWGYHLESEILLINELKEPNASDRRALANNLKPVIAAPPEFLVVNRKGFHPYQTANRTFVLAFSNDQTPISLASQDRRWFAVWSEAPRMNPHEAKKLWDWYHEGGFEAIAAWLYQRDVSMFNPSAAPKETEFKQNLIENGMSSAEAYIVDMIRGRVGEFSAGVISSPFHALCDRLSGTAPQGTKLYPAALLHSLQESGWVDKGKCASKQFTTHKRIFCAPEISDMSKSELRNMIEEEHQPTIIRLVK